MEVVVGHVDGEIWIRSASHVVLAEGWSCVYIHKYQSFYVNKKKSIVFMKFVSYLSRNNVM